MQIKFGEEEYIKFLNTRQAENTHAGYFSIDKKSNRIVDSKLGDRKERTSDDSDAYDLIMKNKERLLDRAEPVRFIFSHSALREGWDNPNVFQICTLKQSGSDVRKRQEVGRGLRLSVNQNGERMDINLLGEDVHNINVLTVIANESYDSFAKGLQSEIAEAVADRPRKVTPELFKGKVIKDAGGAKQVDGDLAQSIYEGLIASGYVKKGVLTEKYYADKKNGAIEIAPDTWEAAADCKDDVIAILDSVYEPVKLDNARSNNVEAALDRKKLDGNEFKALWTKINAKSAYIVKFDEAELVAKAIAALNRELRVSQIFVTVEGGVLDDIASRENLLAGSAMVRKASKTYTVEAAASASVKYDLVGKIVTETGLTRKAVVDILSGIEKHVFDQFKNNPEEFIIRASGIINEQKATVIIQHITYDKLESVYDTMIFTEPTLKGQLGVTAMPANKHLYDHIIYDSDNERKFATKIDSANEVAVYVKLPRGFYISTPVGKYNPDWAIAFHEGKVKHIYFVAETKGSMSSMQLRKIEEAKIHCAREHFKAISTDSVVYDVVDSYEALMDKVMR
jgi:type III restriction enzyme